MQEQNVSPFQVELLQYLLKDVDKKLNGEIHAESEHFASYKKRLLDAIASKSNHSFTEILDQYHHLHLNEKSQLIEKDLFDFFQSKNLPLKVLRGLPRLYQKSNPSRSKLKEEFSNLVFLKRLAFDRFLLPAYESYQLPEGTKICLLAYMCGGFGDLVALKESYQILQKRFPNLEIKTVLLAPKDIQNQAHYYSSFDHVVFYEKDCPPSLFPKETMDELSSSDLILSIPTFYPFISTLKSLLSKPNFLSIGEYGFLESNWFHPQSNNFSMGLHFLEKGIFIRETSLKTDFRALENISFLRILFGTSLPKNEDIDHYLDTHSLYFAYLISPIGGATYLHTLLQLEKERSQAIDLCSPDIGWLIEYLKERSEKNLPFFIEDFGIQEMEIHFDGAIHTRTLAKSGKKLRIIAPENLSDSDFRDLIRLSNEFVAIRGDQSFSEAVSANKLFFYDGAPHAKYFIKDLVALAENSLSQHEAAKEYFRCMAKVFAHSLEEESSEWVEEHHFQVKEDFALIAKSMVRALRTKGTLGACKALNQIIIKEHSFNQTLCHLVQREIAQKYDISLQNLTN